MNYLEYAHFMDNTSIKNVMQESMVSVDVKQHWTLNTHTHRDWRTCTRFMLGIKLLIALISWTFLASSNWVSLTVKTIFSWRGATSSSSSSCTRQTQSILLTALWVRIFNTAQPNPSYWQLCESGSSTQPNPTHLTDSSVSQDLHSPTQPILLTALWVGIFDTAQPNPSYWQLCESGSSTQPNPTHLTDSCMSWDLRRSHMKTLTWYPRAKTFHKIKKITPPSRHKMSQLSEQTHPSTHKQLSHTHNRHEIHL